MLVRIRKALISDSDFFYNLKNNPLNRKFSFNNEKIKPQSHKKWFKNNLKKRNKILLVAYLNRAHPIATIRYDVQKSLALVSIIIEKKFRGKGYGVKILKKSEKFLKKGMVIISKVKKKIKIQ